MIGNRCVMCCSCEKEILNVHSVNYNEKRSLPVRCCVAFLREYKRYISPLLPPSCRFTPTCSEYAIDALRSRGFMHGIVLAVLRLLRCHPFARGGYDPVD